MPEYIGTCFTRVVFYNNLIRFLRFKPEEKKILKLCTKFKHGENLQILLVAAMGVLKCPL